MIDSGGIRACTCPDKGINIVNRIINQRRWLRTSMEGRGYRKYQHNLSHVILS